MAKFLSGFLDKYFHGFTWKDALLPLMLWLLFSVQAVFAYQMNDWKWWLVMLFSAILFLSAISRVLRTCKRRKIAEEKITAIRNWLKLDPADRVIPLWRAWSRQTQVYLVRKPDGKSLPVYCYPQEPGSGLHVYDRFE